MEGAVLILAAFLGVLGVSAALCDVPAHPHFA